MAGGGGEGGRGGEDGAITGEMAGVRQATGAQSEAQGVGQVSTGFSANHLGARS